MAHIARLLGPRELVAPLTGAFGSASTVSMQAWTVGVVSLLDSDSSLEDGSIGTVSTRASETPSWGDF